MSCFRILNKEGHCLYKSTLAKKKYADQLLSLSEKSFLAVIAPVFGFVINNSQFEIILAFMVLSLLFITGGFYFRHQGLSIYDYLAEQQTENSEKQNKTLEDLS